MKTNSKVISIMQISTLDMKPHDAWKEFAAFKQRGIITGGDFDDSTWHLCDERTKCNIDFAIDEEAFQKNFGFLGISAETMVYYMKIYALHLLGCLITQSIQSIIREVRCIIKERDEVVFGSTKQSFYFLRRVIEFLTVLPCEDDAAAKGIQVLCDALENLAEALEAKGFGKQRTLASFDSYFKFDKGLNEYWAKADDVDKRQFFPVYLWWKLSGVLPIRPVEFVLTPRNCISEVNGEYYIRIRKTILKGRKSKVTYKIESDYEIHSYSIPRALAEDILWYIEETNRFGGNELSTLFCADTHYTRWGRCKPYTSRYFTYANMATCLRYFYSIVLEDRFGYKIVYDRMSSYLNDNEINYLHLGDTRHLAMINLIASGSTPLVAMKLAGHNDIEISAHYYSNITRFIECKVYRQYKALLKGQEQYSISGAGRKLQVGEFQILDNKGRCYSPRFRVGNFDDCAKVAGYNGEIGYCPNCDYYYPETKSLVDTADRYESRIEAECTMLKNIVNGVRQNRGEPEDIVQALMNLRSAEHSYEAYLREKMERGA